MNPAPAVPAGPVGFDLDLTLIDSRPAILAAWTEVAQETGVTIDLDAVDRRMGLKLEDEAAFWFPADQVAPASALYRRHYVRLAPGLTTALPGAHDVAGRGPGGGRLAGGHHGQAPGLGRARACGPPG